MTDYKDLIIWQKSRLLVRTVYILTRKLPEEELFGLTNQVRRAVVSIPSNIAEGFNRGSDKEFIHFLRIAKGSAAEVETQLILCVDLEYLQPDEIKEAISLYNEIIRMLGALIVKIDKRIQEKK
ncbi:four helix bundle protein [uncultured Dialister sp.]|mgnify:CR=1 FL=1|uniref:four helix bundle protein n=1 Tax=uncultured Dialister sp. TaxID=278064 RepID=UPI0025EC3732|nr:four helix bundle protein [uncultured Dialister sp.]